MKATNHQSVGVGNISKAGLSHRKAKDTVIYAPRCHQDKFLECK